jgi:hypothetical protein
MRKWQKDWAALAELFVPVANGLASCQRDAIRCHEWIGLQELKYPSSRSDEGLPLPIMTWSKELKERGWSDELARRK